MCAGACVFAMAASCFADYSPYKERIKEGIDMMAMSPKPLLDSVKEEYNAAEFKPFGVIGGFLKGLPYSIKELSVGLYRVLTFNVERW